MPRSFALPTAAIVMLCQFPSLHAEMLPGLPLKVDVRHVANDKWRVDYQFTQPVTAITMPTVADYRQRAWKILTPGMRLEAVGEQDVIAATSGKPFMAASVEITTFDGFAPKDYASFTRFTDGGTAIYLGHLQGEARRGKQKYEMQTDIKLTGLPKENVIAPPLNRQMPGGARGYAYFGPAQAVSAGGTKILMDPETPPWARETVLDAGAKLSQYYETAYQRALRDELLIMVAISGFDAPGLSMKGGAVMGQLSYRFEGKALVGDHPKKRDYLARLVAHEMAHVWQMSIARGGVGPDEPWVHEGGAEAMALDGLQQTGLFSEDKVQAYRAEKTATCEKLGHSVASYDGIYACGLMRFDQLGVAIVPLWRSMMQATEVKGDVYSGAMIEALVREQGEKWRPGGAN